MCVERSGNIFFNVGPILATENLKMHMILALLNFNISFWLYIYIASRKIVISVKHFVIFLSERSAYFRCHLC